MIDLQKTISLPLLLMTTFVLHLGLLAKSHQQLAYICVLAISNIEIGDSRWPPQYFLANSGMVIYLLPREG